MTSTETRVTTRATARAAASKSSSPHPSPSHPPTTTKPHASQDLTKSRPHSSRRRPPHLQPLAVGQITPKQRRQSGTYVRYPVTGNALAKASDAFHYTEDSPQTPVSTSSLATPGLEQVRRYYRDNNLRTAFQVPGTPNGDTRSDGGHSPRAPPLTPFTPIVGRRGSFGVGRRGSTMVTPTSQLVNHFGKLTTLSPVSARSPVGSPRFASRTYRQRSIVDENREILLEGGNRDELTGHRRRRPSEAPFTPISKPPKERLREWGPLYLGNAASADVFVRALHIRKGDERRDSGMTNTHSEDSHEHDEHEGKEGMRVPKTDEDFFMLRARVIPFASSNTRERKPFMIQRKLNKADLKSMAEAASKEQHRMRKQSLAAGTETSRSEKSGPKERSKSASSSHTTGNGEEFDNPVFPGRPHIDPKRVVMPIHMEYALKYLPILGLLMLSGHVRKGDTIDLPMPHPEAWNETATYAYTGYQRKDGLSEGAKENILHLAGVVDDEETETEGEDMDDNKATKNGGNGKANGKQCSA